VAQAAARTAISDAVQKAGQRGRAADVTVDDKKIAAGTVQALTNLLDNVTKVSQSVQAAEGFERDKKNADKSSANQKFANGNPDAQALAATVKAATQATENVLGAASGPVERVWSALKLQETGNRQFDKFGNPQRSMPGDPDSPVGIAQIRPSTAREVAAKNGIPFDLNALNTDSAYNEKLGKLYLGQQIQRYGGDVNLGLAAYNWGPGKFDNFLGQKTKDGRSYDYRDPTGVTKDEFLQLLSQASPETGRYVSTVGRGIGALGRLNNLEGNSGLMKQSEDNSALLRQLEAKLAEATTEPEKEFLKGQIDDLQTAQTSIRSRLESARAEAATALKKTDQAAARALKAQLAKTDQEMQGTLDPDKAEALGVKAVTLITDEYKGHIETLERSSAKMGKTGEYSDEVKEQLESLRTEMDAAVKTQIEKNAQHVGALKERIRQEEFKSEMRASDRAFASFMNKLKQDEQTRAVQMAIDLKQNARPVTEDQAQAQFMGDPRFAGRFSGVQRQSLSMKAAADQDATDAKDLVTYSANLRALQELRARAERELAKTAGLGDEGDGTKGSATGLFAKRDALAPSLRPEDQAEFKRTEDEITRLSAKRQQSQAEITDLKNKEVSLTEKQAQLEAKMAAKNEATPFGLMEGINAANQNFLTTHDQMALALDDYNQLLNQSTNAFAKFFDDILTGSKSAGEAIKDFARSFLQAMLQILEQQAALAVVKSIIGAFGGGGSGVGGGAGMTGGFDSAGTAFAIQGGVVSAGGTITRGGSMRRYIGGGKVQGPINTRDSVHALLQPGEVVMNTSAVDSVGEDFLNGLNAQGNRVVSKSTPAPQAKREKQPDHVNVWVVAPDQKPQLGPRDVLATISDDIIRGGSTKQLIKQVAMGQV
jgi:lambda family phage tail tape measure protein